MVGQQTCSQFWLDYQLKEFMSLNFDGCLQADTIIIQQGTIELTRALIGIPIAFDKHHVSV